MTPVFEWFFIGFWLFLVANIVLVVWALIDAIKVPDDSMFAAGNKLIWVLVILLGGFVGAIVYLAAGRPPRGGDAAGPRALTDPTLPPPPGGTFS